MRYLLVLLLANTAYASDTCCVDEDIAEAFLAYTTFSRDWPADFPLRFDFEGFEFIGSSTYPQAPLQLVAWKSELTPQSSLDLVRGALLENDWIPMPESDSMRSRSERGFIPHRVSSRQEYQGYCRGREGTLSVKARQSTIGTVVVLTHSRDNKGRDCAGMIAATRNTGLRHETGMAAYLPALMLPESIKTNSGSGFGSSGYEAEASMSVTADVSAAEVSTYFESQMRSQQWTLESDIQGSKTSGHVWRRTVDGLNLVCIVLAIESEYRLRLKMQLEAL